MIIGSVFVYIFVLYGSLSQARSMGYFSAGAEVELGRSDGNMDYSMYKATINTECGTESEYEAVYEYGQITAR